MTEQQREAFHQWLERERYPGDTEFHLGEYASNSTQHMWEAWQAALSHAERREFKTEQDLINFLDGLYETAGPDSSALTGQKWAPAQRAIEGIRSHAEGEAVATIRDERATVDRLNVDDLRRICMLPAGTKLYTHPAPQVAVPEGHVLVPVEPTPEMEHAGSLELNGSIGGYEAERLTSAWNAMLDAAPTAPAGEPDDSDICEQVELPHVLAWADGIRGDMWTEYADRITDEEARVAQAVWAAHTGERPVSNPDGLPDRVLMPRALTAENGAKTALMGEFDFSVTMTCPECHPDEPNPDCEVCSGSVEYEQPHTVPWTTIKRIYAAAVDLLSAPAPDERAIVAPACEWSTDDEWDDDNWESECGASWTFPDGGPAENGMKFCPECGLKVRLRTGNDNDPGRSVKPHRSGGGLSPSESDSGHMGIATEPSVTDRLRAGKEGE